MFLRKGSSGQEGIGSDLNSFNLLFYKPGNTSDCGTFQISLKLPRLAKFKLIGTPNNYLGRKPRGSNLSSIRLEAKCRREFFSYFDKGSIGFQGVSEVSDPDLVVGGLINHCGRPFAKELAVFFNSFGCTRVVP